MIFIYQWNIYWELRKKTNQALSVSLSFFLFFFGANFFHKKFPRSDATCSKNRVVDILSLSSIFIILNWIVKWRLYYLFSREKNVKVSAKGRTGVTHGRTWVQQPRAGVRSVKRQYFFYWFIYCFRVFVSSRGSGARSGAAAERCESHRLRDQSAEMREMREMRDDDARTQRSLQSSLNVIAI